MSYTNFPNGLTSFGIPVHGSLPFTMANSGVGKIFFVDTNNGSNGNVGNSPDNPVATVNQALSNATSNRGDIIVVAGSSGSNVLSAPLDVTKNRLTFIGADPMGRLVQQGAKVATSSTESSAAYVIKNTGTRNAFINLKLIQNSTNAAALRVFDDGGEGTFAANTSFTFGVADNLDQATATEFLAGSDSGTFVDCQFGVDTLLTSAARNVMTIDQVTASQEFKSNRFRGCTFLISSSDTGARFIDMAAAGDILFSNLFEDCTMVASIDSAGGTTLTRAVETPNGVTKGTLYFKNCCVFGASNFGTNGTNNDGIQVYGAANTGTDLHGIAPIAT